MSQSIQQKKSWIIYICSCFEEKWMRNSWLKEEVWEKDMRKDLVIWPLLHKHKGVLRNQRGMLFQGETLREKKNVSTLIVFSSLFVQNVPGCHKARPEASVVHQQLSAPADWASLSICRVIASNQGLQQTNPDRYSHLGFTLGQLWCHPKGGTERGKPAVSNVCRVSARPGWQQHERLSQETSVLLSHSAAGQSIWLQCCANSINSYLPFRSYYAE